MALTISGRRAVIPQLNKYQGDVKSGRRSKANAYRKGYLKAANDIANQYDIKKK